MKRIQLLAVCLVSASLAALFVTAVAFAQQSSSSHYQVNEVYFGSGGELDACSSAYCSKQSAGSLVVGNSSSPDYQMQGGFNTSDKPVLEVAVNGGVFDLGILDAATTKSTSATFTIRNYLSSSYAVRIAGDTPTEASGGHSLAAATTPTAPTPGTEMFGINLRANTDPSGLGADPQELPDTTFGFGYAASGYDTPDMYQYNNDDVVARSDKSSGETYYTMSIIADISHQTPAGDYGGNLSVIVIPTF